MQNFVGYIDLCVAAFFVYLWSRIFAGVKKFYTRETVLFPDNNNNNGEQRTLERSVVF